MDLSLKNRYKHAFYILYFYINKFEINWSNIIMVIWWCIKKLQNHSNICQKIYSFLDNISISLSIVINYCSEYCYTNVITAKTLSNLWYFSYGCSLKGKYPYVTMRKIICNFLYLFFFLYFSNTIDLTKGSVVAKKEHIVEHCVFSYIKNIPQSVKFYN